MDKLFSPMRRDGIATPRKEKALDNKGLDENKLDQTSSDYSKNKPEKLIQGCSHLRGNQRRIALSKAFSLYWKTMMDEGAGHE